MNSRNECAGAKGTEHFLVISGWTFLRTCTTLNKSGSLRMLLSCIIAADPSTTLFCKIRSANREMGFFLDCEWLPLVRMLYTKILGVGLAQILWGRRLALQAVPGMHYLRDGREHNKSRAGPDQARLSLHPSLQPRYQTNCM